MKKKAGVERLAMIPAEKYANAMTWINSVIDKRNAASCPPSFEDQA